MAIKSEISVAEKLFEYTSNSSYNACGYELRPLPRYSVSVPKSYT